MSNRAAGTLVIASNTDRVLLLRRADGQGWDQPGGMSDGEEDPADTATREFEEETGLDAAYLQCGDNFTVRRLPDGSYVTYMPRPPARADLVYTVFVCTFPTEFEPRLSHEHMGWGWFDVESVPADVHPGTLLALQVLQRKGFL